MTRTRASVAVGMLLMVAAGAAYSSGVTLSDAPDIRSVIGQVIVNYQVTNNQSTAAKFDLAVVNVGGDDGDFRDVWAHEPGRSIFGVVIPFGLRITETAELAPGESHRFAVVITRNSWPGAGSLNTGDILSLKVTATSQSDPSQTSSDTFTVTVIEPPPTGTQPLRQSVARDADCDGDLTEPGDGAFTETSVLVSPGQCFVYRLTGQVTGPSASSSFRFTASLPSGFEMETCSGRCKYTETNSYGDLVPGPGYRTISSSIPSDGSPVNVDIQRQPSGAGFHTLSFTVRVQEDAESGAYRFASRQETTLLLSPTPLTRVPGSATQVKVRAVPGLTLTGGADRDGSAAEMVTFGFTVTNTGNVQDTFTLAAANAGGDDGNFDRDSIKLFADIDGDGAADDATPITTTGMLAAGAAYHFVVLATIPASVQSGETYLLIATAVSQRDSEVMADHTAAARIVDGARMTTVLQRALDTDCDGDLDGDAIFTTVTSGVDPDQCIVYRITATNVAAASIARTVSIATATPAFTELETCSGKCAYTVTDGSGDAVTLAAGSVTVPDPQSTGPIRFTLGDIPAAESRIAIFTVKALDHRGRLTDMRAVTTYLPKQLATVATNRSNLVRTIIRSESGLTLEGGRSVTAAAGDTVSFAYTVRNTGKDAHSVGYSVVNADANSVDFDNLGLFIDSDQDGEFDDALGSNPLDLEAGEVLALVARATIPTTAAPGVSLAVTLTATSRQTSTVTASRTSLATVQVLYSATLTDAANQIADAGDWVTFGYDVTNDGNVADTFDLATTDLDLHSDLPIEEADLPADIRGTIKLFADRDDNDVADDNTAITDTGKLAPGATFHFVVSVKLSASFVPGDGRRFRLTATSRGDIGERASTKASAEVLVHGVTLTGGHDLSAAAGETVTFAYTVVNTSKIPDYFTVTASDTVGDDGNFASDSIQVFADSDGDRVADDSTMPITATGTVASGARYAFVVRATIPPDAEPRDRYSVLVTVTSQQGRDNSASDTATARFEVYGVTLTGGDDVRVAHGEPVTFRYAVTNAGNVPDTFTLAAADATDDDGDFASDSIQVFADSDADGNADSATPVTATGELAAGATYTFIVRAVNPSEAGLEPPGRRRTLTVTATSRGDDTKTARDTATATMGEAYGVALSATADPSAAAGETASFLYTVTNRGNVPDTFDLTAVDAASGDRGDFDRIQVFADPDADGKIGNPTPITATVVLAPGGTYSFVVRAAVPARATLGDTYAVTVTATSQGDRRQSASDRATATLPMVYGVTLVSDMPKQNAAPGTLVVFRIGSSTRPVVLTVGTTTMTFRYTVINQGNGPDTFNLVAAAVAADAGRFESIRVYADADADGKADSTVAITDTGEIPAGAAYHFVVRARTKSAASRQLDVLSLTVSATSQGDGKQSASDRATAILNWVNGITLSYGADVVATAGETVTFRYTATNRGNSRDSIKLAAVDGDRRRWRFR